LRKLNSRQTLSYGRAGAHNTLIENTKPAYDGRKRVINFWVFDKSNEEVLISNTNSVLLSQYYQSLIASMVWWAVEVG
jgi:hypothetical protein